MKNYQTSWSLFDDIFVELNRALVTLGGATTGTRPSPGEAMSEADLSVDQKRHSAGLMRINHTGEVCAQALYRGHGAGVSDEAVKAHMLTACEEECDHLVWCDERLQDFGSHRSYLDPLWYVGSFAMGYVSGKMGSKVALSYVLETEQQVQTHLVDHLNRLPSQDKKSQAILQQMYVDEQGHADQAREMGGDDFPKWINMGMQGLSTVMTRVTYWF